MTQLSILAFVLEVTYRIGSRFPWWLDYNPLRWCYHRHHEAGFAAATGGQKHPRQQHPQGDYAHCSFSDAACVWDVHMHILPALVRKSPADLPAPIEEWCVHKSDDQFNRICR